MKINHCTVALFFALLLVVLTSGCGKDDPVAPPIPTVRATVGAGGGTVDMPNEATLTVPPGALDGNTEFTIAKIGSNHRPMVAGRDLKSAVYRLGPAGTTFNEMVPLTLYFDDDSLDGLDPSTLVIYTDRGNGWTPVPTTVDKALGSVTGRILRLSDFAVTAPSSEAADGVYALFEVVRLINYVQDPIVDVYADMIVARFDSVVNMCGVVRPLHPGSVTCNDDALLWDEFSLAYVDQNETPDFLVPGDPYRFVVTPSLEVPEPLDQTIQMVDVLPTIRNLRNLDPVSRSGFTLQWDGTSDGEVHLSFVTNNMDALEVLAPNTGSYTFTEQQLSQLNPGLYYLNLGYYNMRFLDNVPGYDPRSHIAAYSLSGKLVHLLDSPGVVGPEGGIVLLGSDGRLTIPAGSLTETVAFTASVNSSPPAGPEGYTRLSPVYRVGPAGTTFSPPATVELHYNPAGLGGAPENTVVILKHDGSGWTALDSDVDTDDKIVEAEVSSLSDFVAAVPEPGQGVYAVISISRSTTTMFFDDEVLHTTVDALLGRFDSVVDESSVDPLQAGGVAFEDLMMEWDPDSENYYYFDWLNRTFLNLGEDYQLVVTASDDVPALDTTVSVMNSELFMTGLDEVSTFSLSGFTLTWNGASLGSTVSIVMLVHGHFDGVSIEEAPNTGSYTFTAAQLAVLIPGEGQIAILWEQESSLTGPGYHALSHVSQWAHHNAVVTFE